MKRAVRLLIPLLLAASIAHAQQQQFATLQKGFQADKLYHFGDIDHVNVFNGNLIITFPIGLEYPLNGGLSYQLQLSYNSKSWDYESIPTRGVTRARPTKRSNAGFGWILGLGRFIAADDIVRNSTYKPVYEAPDGGDHVFDSNQNQTSDGSNLRLSTVNGDKQIDFPDGTTRRFSNIGGTEWELREIRGARPATPDGVTITRLTNAPECPNSSFAWRISDSRTRNHYVCFQNYRVDDDWWPMVTKVLLEATDNEQSLITFDYDANVTVPKPIGDTDWDSAQWRQTHVVPMLKSVTLPDLSKFQFTYYPGSGGPIQSLTLPTLGKIEYAYEVYLIPSLEKCANNYGLGYGFGSNTSGIWTRTFIPAVSAGQTATPQVWTYEQSLSELAPNGNNYVAVENCTPADPTDPNRAPNYPYLYDMLTAKVTDPAGHVVKNYFSVFPGHDAGRLPDANTSPAGFKRRYYGYPYGPYDPSQDRYISQQHVAPSNVPVRTLFVRHDVHALPLQQDGDPESPHTLASQRTVFNDDPLGSGGHYIESDSTNWDGYGHYRTVTSGGSFGAHPERKQTVTTTWNMLNGVARAIYPEDKWLLNTYESVTTSEGDGGTFVEQACFDSTGFLTARRQLAGSTPASNDLLSVVELGTDGNPQREKYYGGDATPLPAGANQTYLCSALSSLNNVTPDYQVTHTWQNGQMATSQVPGMPFPSMDLTIDRSGLITKSRDPAGLETTYSYDTSGRLEMIAPPGAASTSIVYDNASMTSGTFTPAKATQSTGSGEQEVKSIYEFDSFGRVVLQRQRMPSDPNNPTAEKWSARQTSYDVLGQKEWESELEEYSGGTFTPQHKTLYSNYDQFGRVGRIDAPDGSFVQLFYTGVRQIRRYRTGGGSVALGINSYELYDPFNRLFQVQENAGSNGGVVTTDYSYDAANRLSGVRMSETGAAQSRYFNYDGRGLLMWESQPESGMKSYTYDARGHMRSVELGGARTMFDLKYTYDAAERLVKVEARSPANPDAYRVFKEFAYGTDNGTNPADYRRGKLLTATRYNYKPEPTAGYPYTTVRVVETYAYKDAAGRKTDRTTTISNDRTLNGDWVTARNITQAVTYDSMGMPVTVTYPMCENCGAPPGVPWQDITSTYTHGRIATVPNFVNSISYWPNGMRRVLLHHNGMQDTQDLDASGMPRPGSLKSEIYKPCNAPAITSQTRGAVYDSSQGDARLEVTATGSAPMTYRWYDATDPNSAVLLDTGPTFIEVHPASTRQYYATVTNDCRMTRSKTITVKAGTCVNAWINEATATRNPDGTFTLSVSASGTGTLDYSWTRLSDNVVIATVPTTTTSVLASSTLYRVTVTNHTPCGGPAAEAPVSADVPVTVSPMLLIAYQTASNQITVSWPHVSGATYYLVYRREGTTWLAPVVVEQSNVYVDGNLPLNTVYAYRVEAVANGAVIGRSAAEVGSTLQLTSVAAGNLISAAVFDELLQGVNGVRALSGWAPVTWSNVLSPNDPLPSPGQVVFARHLLALRSRLNEAMQALGASAGAYTDADVQGMLIQAGYIAELQTRLK